MSALRTLRAPHSPDEREAACVRFVADLEVAAAHAPSTRRNDLGWLAARAFAPNASEGDWSRLHRAVARLLDDDEVRRVGASHERLRDFVAENHDLS